jgi:hypothetical protein
MRTYFCSSSEILFLLFALKNFFKSSLEIRFRFSNRQDKTQTQDSKVLLLPLPVIEY